MPSTEVLLCADTVSGTDIPHAAIDLHGIPYRRSVYGYRPMGALCYARYSHRLSDVEAMHAPRRVRYSSTERIALSLLRDA
eukprot:1200101-Rhodomonas_salina.1